MDNTVIIKIESGVVADIYSTEPVKIIVVDYDLIEGDETFERRCQKAVLSMVPDCYVKPEDIDTAVSSLVEECVRPARRRPLGTIVKTAA